MLGYSSSLGEGLRFTASLVWSLRKGLPVRVLIAGVNYVPEPVGIGKFTGEMAEWLAARGDSVRVVTAPPHYPSWTVQDGYSAWRYTFESLHGVEVLRCPLWVPRRVSGLARGAYQGAFALASAPVLLAQGRWRPDVVLTVMPPMLVAPTASAVARLCGVPSWLHVQDLEVDAAFNLGMLRSSHLRKLMLWLERRVLRAFDVVSAPSMPMLRHVANKGVPADRCKYFPNWVDTSAIYPLEEPSPLRREFGLVPGHPVALYSGSMGGKHGLEVVIEAARLLPEVTFVLCGDGPGRPALEGQGRGLSNLLWLPIQPLSHLNALLNLGDVHLLPQRPGAADFVMPSKLLGMLASGRPVVATAEPGTGIHQAVSGSGLAVAPGDVRAFATAVRRLTEDPETRRGMGRAGRALAVSDWDKNAVLEKFRTELATLASAPSHRLRQ